MTAANDQGDIRTFDHDVEQAVRTDRRVRNNQKRMSSCRTGSRRWKRRRAVNQRLRGKVASRRRHQRRAWANRLTHRYDTLCVEKLKTGNMTRSSRGASETPGSNVRQKSGLNRSLLGVAPSKQTAILVRSAERNGTRIELVPAHGTSRRCNACGYTHRKNRESQARFRCAACGHTDNADANAARNIRGPGRRLHPGADERVPGRWTPSSQRNRCRAEDRTAGGIWPSREGRPARKGACQGAIEVPALPREAGRHRNPGRKAEHRNPGLTARYRVDSQRGSSMRSESSVAVETEETATRYTFRIVPWFATGCHGGGARQESEGFAVGGYRASADRPIPRVGGLRPCPRRS